MVFRAGLETIPAYVRKVGEEEVLALALIENIQREDLNAMEIALSYERLLEECHLTQDELSERVFYACAGANLPILRMDQKKASLEDVFLELTAAEPEQTEERTELKGEIDEAEEGGEEP